MDAKNEIEQLATTIKMIVCSFCKFPSPIQSLRGEELKSSRIRSGQGKEKPRTESRVYFKDVFSSNEPLSYLSRVES